MANNRGSHPQMQFSMMVPVTPVVRWLIGINVGIWIIFQLILEGYFLSGSPITRTFGFVPENFITHFYVWEPLTYMFLHSRNVFHITFNMLLLWWLGAELEQRWGSKFFLSFYLVSGIGAGIIYGLVVLLHGLVFTPSVAVWETPVVGASGAIFGLMLAYGMIFGERVVYFMMVFPMRAKYFVMILGAVEVVTLLNNGMGHGDVANLAHLGGIASGFLFLQGYTRMQQRRWRKQSDRRGRGLKLVVNNDGKDDKGGGGGPKYWN
jgi:membrane associated rhomboid family serine protease